MGVDKKRAPPLPAPTDTESAVGTQLASEVSRVTDKTSYSIPEDGSPVTISTRRKGDAGKKLGHSHNKSQTSLLIEYFEGGKESEKDTNRRPSVRVKVTPSSKSRSRSAHEHIQITESKGTRKPSYTKRISLSPRVNGDAEGDDKSYSSYASATTDSNVTSRGGDPIEIEVMPPRRHGSPLIPTEVSTNSRYIQQNASDISSMPADSFLDGRSSRSPEKRSNISKSEAAVAGAAAGLATAAVADTLKTPTRQRSRSLSRERIVAQKAVEKVRGEKSERRHRHRSHSVSNSENHAESIKSPRKRPSRSHHEESAQSALSGLSGNDSSALTTSQLSASQISGSRRSDDKSSVRSGASASNVSINNPKLLATVEDAIRRLILPELTALKREQSKHASRRERRGSLTSESAVSRESGPSSVQKESRRSSGRDQVDRPKVTLNDGEVLSGNSIKGRKERKGDESRGIDSPHSLEEASEDTVIRDGEVRKKKSGDTAEALAAGGALGVLTAAALHKHESQDSLDEQKERRKRRGKSRSREETIREEQREESRNLNVAPPLPMSSEINPSEMTRTSILSAETERPGSASDLATPIKEVPRGVVSAETTPKQTPVTRRALGMQHSNFSRGDLSLHSQNSNTNLEPDERHSPSLHEDEHVEETHDQRNHHLGAIGAGLVGAVPGTEGMRREQELEDDESLEEYDGYYQYHQEVPPPLRYIPYAEQKRGLSPIQSVSSLREDDRSEPPARESRLAHSAGSFSSINRQSERQKSYNSLSSVGNRSHRVEQTNKHDFPEVRHGGLTDSELTQDSGAWEDMPSGIERGLEYDNDSYLSSADPRTDYKHTSNYTENSNDRYSAEVGAGQNVRGVGANPNFVDTPFGVESAVASLVDASVMTGGSGQSNPNSRNGRRVSAMSFEEGSERHFTSRNNSPTKNTTEERYEEETNQRNSPAPYQGYELNEQDHKGTTDREVSSRNSSPSKYPEYELDEHGRKVTMPQYSKQPTSNVAKKAAAAVAAAGAAIGLGPLAFPKRREHRKFSWEDAPRVDETTGVPLHKSFKERALEGQGQGSPRHSLDHSSVGGESLENIKMSATAIPDPHDPLPETGYGDAESEVTTNPSIIQGPGSSHEARELWPPQPSTPTGKRRSHEDSGLKEAEAALLGAATSAGVAAAVAEHERAGAYDHQDDEWQRTSEERKRDTLITNPYEDASPVASQNRIDHGIIPGAGFAAVNRALDFQEHGSSGALKDEGYISSAPNARSPGAMTPEQRIRGIEFLDGPGIGGATGALGGGDPFYTPNHNRNISDMSNGLGSPLYEAATGHGMDRIQSQDIVALMDHLTVRDAQRSARDTEILVTLVRAAAEMRNSFEDMKRLLADTEDVVITEVQRNTDRSVGKVLSGPRLMTAFTAQRSIKGSSQEEMINDIPNKRRNVFRRALKGLSMRSTNDLAKIEEMLVQLLGDVEVLKVAQGLQSSIKGEGTIGDEHEFEEDRGYVPEGNAGTSTASHGSQSGHFSNPGQARGVTSTRPFETRKFSDHRISTVPEGDEEELEEHEQNVLQNQFENNEALLTPTRQVPRADSVPLNTPPAQVIAQGSASSETTPKTDKSKKHKSSGSSGWIPKISRWSETTASTVARGFRSSGRNSGRKDSKDSNDQNATPPSRSGSDLAQFDYDPHGEDKLPMSQEKLEPYNEPYNEPCTENRASSPFLEDPKYKAHRNSLNLQHPQPRPGPTHRYQTALESQAQNYDNPMSPNSVGWDSNTSINRLPAQNTNRYSAETAPLSPVSEHAYSQGPARPPKEPLEPERPLKIRNKLSKPSPLANVEHVPGDDDYAGSLASDSQPNSPRSMGPPGNLGVPTRKPLGPRAISSAGRGAEDSFVRRNKNRDTFGSVASNHSGESETF